MDSELANVISTLMKDRLPQGKLSEKVNKFYCPENRESLTKVCVNQALWDNLSPSFRLKDIQVQKVETSLFKDIYVLT